MTTEEIAGLIADRIYSQWARGSRNPLERDVYEAIRDLNLIQAEPMPEGAVPVVVYVAANVDENGIVLTRASSCDTYKSGVAAMEGSFFADDTHRVRLEGYALPVAVPTVQAKAVMP